MWVLHIDDDFEEREIFSEALTSIDPAITVIGTSSCACALARLSEDKLPDIIFVDINMPVMNGFEFIQVIKKTPRLEKIPVIFYSTSAADCDIRKGIALGASAYIVKPSDLKTLTQNLKALLYPVMH